MARAIYPGSFDPAHNGHIDIARRAAKVFDELVIAVYKSPPTKRLMFSTEERVELFAEVGEGRAEYQRGAVYGAGPDGGAGEWGAVHRSGAKGGI